jgi:hypothetical protein
MHRRSSSRGSGGRTSSRSAGEVQVVELPRRALWPRGPMISSVGRGRSSPMSHSHTTRMRKSSPHASPAFPWSLARFAALPHRVYAFADPLQMIYGWRDASPQRLTAFRADGASEHTLRTLHRYRTRPDLQRWMEQVRDVLLGGRERVDVARPEEVRSIEYDPTLAERGRIFGAPARELYPSDEPRGVWRVTGCAAAHARPRGLKRASCGPRRGSGGARIRATSQEAQRGSPRGTPLPHQPYAFR